MKFRLAVLAIALAVLGDGQSRLQAAATDKFEQSASFLAASLTRFLDDNVSFTATTWLTVGSVADTDATPSRFALGTALDRGKMRFDFDLTSGLNKELSTGLPQMGIRRMMFIGYPEHPLRIVFPDMKSYVEVPLGSAPKISDRADVAASRLERKLVGEESVGGVLARKYQLHADGAAERAWVWEAPSLNNLPVRLRAETGGQSYTFTFSNIRVGQPDPRVFGIPASFEKAGGMMDIVQRGMARLTEQMNKMIPGR
jgi:hypothetical protein